MKKRLLSLALASAAALPAVALAAPASLTALSYSIQRTVYRPLTYVLISYALLLFVWGIYRYIAQSGDAKGAEEGAKTMTYGILVLLVMTCLWGFVHLGLSFFGFDGGDAGSSVFGVPTSNGS